MFRQRREGNVISGIGNPVDRWTCSNFAHDELQLAVELDQLVHMTAEDTSEFWIQLEHVHGSTEFTARMGPWKRPSVRK